MKTVQWVYDDSQTPGQITRSVSYDYGNKPNSEGSLDETHDPNKLEIYEETNNNFNNNLRVDNEIQGINDFNDHYVIDSREPARSAADRAFMEEEERLVGEERERGEHDPQVFGGNKYLKSIRNKYRKGIKAQSEFDLELPEDYEIYDTQMDHGGYLDDVGLDDPVEYDWGPEIERNNKIPRRTYNISFDRDEEPSPTINQRGRRNKETKAIPPRGVDVHRAVERQEDADLDILLGQGIYAPDVSDEVFEDYDMEYEMGDEVLRNLQRSDEANWDNIKAIPPRGVDVHREITRQQQEDAALDELLYQIGNDQEYEEPGYIDLSNDEDMGPFQPLDPDWDTDIKAVRKEGLDVGMSHANSDEYLNGTSNISPNFRGAGHNQDLYYSENPGSLENDEDRQGVIDFVDTYTEMGNLLNEQQMGTGRFSQEALAEHEARKQRETESMREDMQNSSSPWKKLKSIRQKYKRNGKNKN